MEANNKPFRIYWDSSCFLAILNAEAEALTCITILEEAEQGKIELVISPLSMAETVRPKSSPKPISKDDKDKVLKFFDASYIKMVNFNREVARLSLEYCWDHNLKPKDSLHLAMAVEAGCDYFESKDSDFLRLTNDFTDIMKIRLPTGASSMELLQYEEPAP